MMLLTLDKTTESRWCNRRIFRYVSIVLEMLPRYKILTSKAGGRMLNEMHAYPET